MTLLCHTVQVADKSADMRALEAKLYTSEEAERQAREHLVSGLRRAEQELVDSEGQADQKLKEAQAREEAQASELAALRSDLSLAKQLAADKDAALSSLKEQVQAAEEQANLLRKQLAEERNAFVESDRERVAVSRDLEAKTSEADSLLDQLNQCSREKRAESNALAVLRAQICRMEQEAAETKSNHDRALQASQAAEREAAKSLEGARAQNLVAQQTITTLKREEELRTQQQQRMMQELETSVHDKEALVHTHRTQAAAVQTELKAIREEAAGLDQRCTSLRVELEREKTQSSSLEDLRSAAACKALAWVSLPFRQPSLTRKSAHATTLISCVHSTLQITRKRSVPE